MNEDYQRIVAALNMLTQAELILLLEQVAARLKSYSGAQEEETADEIDDTSRRYLPRLPRMIEWGLVVPMEDTLYIRDIPEHPALLLDATRVAYQGETLPINDWAKQITGWKSVNIYEWVVVKRAGRTLDNLRQAYMNK